MILDSVDRSTALGKRNYAILLIAARLGIRATDIRNLKFDNLNWQTGEIRLVQHKTQNELVLPLTEEIGSAIIDYLQNGRPKVNNNFLFIRHIAPYEQFAELYKFNNIVAKHFSLAKISIPKGKAHGLHSFRHSLASNMLSAKTPLPVISSVLGHSDCTITCRYIKVDIEQLRQCALEICIGGEEI
ncbi:MAG: tyrosine-type recombinase/integrase [Eubacterium sp.]|nr:tyrosine-type recombinase/integrase [Eubacterium sp.]